MRELQSRRLATKDERQKIDYCTLTYENELENLSFIFNMLKDSGAEDSIPRLARTYMAIELRTLIRQYVSIKGVTA